MLLHISTVPLFTAVHFFFQVNTLHAHINMHIPHCVLGRSKFRGAAHQTSANRLIMKAQSFIPWRRLAKNNWQAPRSLPLCHQGQVNDNAELLRHKRRDSPGGNKNRKGRLQSRPSVCSLSFFLSLFTSIFFYNSSQLLLRLHFSPQVCFFPPLCLFIFSRCDSQNTHNTKTNTQKFSLT